MPSSEADRLFERCLRELRETGLLLKSDAKFPSVTTFAAGGPIRGSWWGHPKGGVIFSVLERLADHEDVLLAKLLSRKDTFVHRALWPDLLGALRQTGRRPVLSPAARRLLALIERDGARRADELPKALAAKEAVQELELGLQLHAEEFHTEKGAHAKRLESWRHWAKRKAIKPAKPAPADPGAAAASLAARLRELNDRHGANATLPF